jgi:hypothetical protein
MFLPDYMPTNLDILHCRLKTTGITETVFQLGQLSYKYIFPLIGVDDIEFAMLADSDQNDGNGYIALKM